MTPNLFVHRSHLGAAAEDVFAWHARAGAFERLQPPWERVTLVRHSGGIQNGAEAEIQMHIGPWRQLWLARHSGCVAGRQFRDDQVEGPFAAWSHLHCFEPDGPDASYLEDRIEYQLPGGALGEAVAGRYVARQLNRLFRYRHAVTESDLAIHRRYQSEPRMKVLLSGSGGMVGRALRPFLTTGGHGVVPLVRQRAAAPHDDVLWDPSARQIETEKLNGLDAVVHLAGENIGNSRWTEANKERFYQSRVPATRWLCETLAKLPQPPKVIVCASATGFYGHRAEEELDEASSAGSGFIAELTRDWEAATEPARQRGIRVVNLRFGIVLTPAGGALAKMLPPFRAGVGGPMGGGRQFWPWISLDDALGVIHHALMTRELQGPVNAVAPMQVRNRDFAKTLGQVLHRPAVLPLPAGVLRLALGEMADAALLASARVLPEKLQRTGYRFIHPGLKLALRHLLGRHE